MSQIRDFNVSAIFDRQAVLDMVDGEIDFVCELIDLFLADLGSQRSAIESGMSTNNADLVQKTCHRLKTSVGNLGGTSAHLAVIRLEQFARSGALNVADLAFADFVAEMDQFEAALRDFLSEQSAPA